MRFFESIVCIFAPGAVLFAVCKTGIMLGAYDKSYYFILLYRILFEKCYFSSLAVQNRHFCPSFYFGENPFIIEAFERFFYTKKFVLFLRGKKQKNAHFSACNAVFDA